MTDVSDVVPRFQASMTALGGMPGDGPLLVAVSGGLDSCVLLHLLRFATTPRPEVVVAHFDHGMRPQSEADADWVRGLCRGWGVRCVIGRAHDVPASEGAARSARYDFLHSVTEEAGAARLLTAHHADDQAETVLFRVLRGTGIDGLRGIPAARAPNIARPLLDFWREDLEGYARSVRLAWRDDASNEHLGYARNMIRRRLLPDAEAHVAPGARRALVRLAGIAAENEDAWAAVLPDVIAHLDVVRSRPAGDVGADGLTLSCSKEAVEGLPPALRARVMRHLAAEVGRVLDSTATRRAVDFADSSRSGSRIDLGGGIELRTELDRLVLGRSSSVAPDEVVQIPDAGPGSGAAILGGRSVSVVWGSEEGPPVGEAGEFAVAQLDFPLTVRGRRPGDRISLMGGTSKVKKLLLEARIPLEQRSQVPLLVDGAGRVLWVPGVARTSDIDVGEGGRSLKIRIGR